MPIANIVRSGRIVATRCAPINRQFSDTTSSQEGNDRQGAESSGAEKGSVGRITDNTRLNKLARDVACLSVTIQHLSTKVDDGFKRIDGWMKVGLGLFVGTILMELAYLDKNMKH